MADSRTRTGTAARPRPRGAWTAVAGTCLAGVMVLALTGCEGDDAGAAGSPSTQPASTAPGAGASPTADAATGATPTGTPSPDVDDTTAAPPAATPTAAAKPVGSVTPSPSAKGGGGGGGGADDGCDHKMPISPDELAVYRYTPEGGSLSLIVKYGNWGCPEPDSDGPPFETVGKEIWQPLDQAAQITVTTPIVESTENQPIGVQEFIDWLDAHPDSGLVFEYHLGADGAIDRLDQVFTP
ncbi:hypothetical protein [Streptomyces lichenis]|uniref:Lipoprotein n=1 Tax=Streptomyces lichenis TaxID=2306967 RepID=A0ABT0I460_9ACTN|nr:hypothetical protein [Streptomyces lichenis]MCK8676112.1 hypothetical protein [Streptomyces lichenis]